MKTLKYNSSYKFIKDKSGESPTQGEWVRDIYTDVLVKEDTNLQSDEVQRHIADQLVQSILFGWYVNHAHVLRSPGGKDVLVIQAFSVVKGETDEQYIIIAVRMS